MGMLPQGSLHIFFLSHSAKRNSFHNEEKIKIDK